MMAKLQQMSESSTEMHGEVRMIAESSYVKYMHSVLSGRSVHSVCTILSIYSLHYVLVSDVCSVSGDTWVLSIQP